MTAESLPEILQDSRTRRVQMKWCRECDLVFDLSDEDDANEWHYGHDCEGE